MKYPDAYGTGGGSLQTGKTFTYAFDSLGRPQTMTEYGASDWVWNVQYNIAGQMTSLTHARGSLGGATETRTYNEIGQMTALSNATLSVSLQYVFPTGGVNNGRITAMIDGSQQVNYQYDELNRLTRAETATSGGSTDWGMTFGYDGFGNLTDQTPVKGSGVPNMSLTVTAGTNRLNNGRTYDANGNMLPATCSGNDCFDIENRLVAISTGTVTIGYAADNKRMFERRTVSGLTEDHVTFYGIDGTRMAMYKMVDVAGSPATLKLEKITENYFFGRRMIWAGSDVVVQDRLGSVVARQNVSSGTITRFKYFPYGQEQGSSTADDREQFGTYLRDGATGLDYADQRYYGYSWGRFASADPYQASGGASEPGSWNRYLYVGGDPVNWYDPRGLFMQIPGPDDGGGGGSGPSIGGPPPVQYFPDPGAGSGEPQGEGGSGGGGSGPSTKQRKLNEAFSAVFVALLTKDCRALFAPTGANTPVVNPTEVLRTILYGGTVNGRTIGSLKEDAKAINPYIYTTGFDRASGKWTGADIILPSSGGASIEGNKSTGVRTLAMTLLHELGHVFDLVSGLGGSKIVNEQKPDGSMDGEKEAQNEKTLGECSKAWNGWQFPIIKD